ncbi:MAG: transglutaminase family protein [Planctomycetales bacterium]|nr:transglutaminase family protein [Planctomycetales bacterium]
MRYKVSHTTTYDYDAPVAVCQNIVYLTPRSTPYQNCTYHRLTVRPTPTSPHRRTDYFGNTASLFSLSTGHRKLQITANSTVEMIERDLPAMGTPMPWEAVREILPLQRTEEGLADYQFCFPSTRVPNLPELEAYGRLSFTTGRPIIQALRDLTHRINTDFKYDATATNVNTPIAQAFSQKRGVCQDFAHVMIGCLRPLGLAARYVSGYLRTHRAADQPRLVGADASHAWVSLYCGALGWVDADPTNDLLPSAEHITVAWGRDFGDVCPVAGMFVGGGSHRLTVAVDVTPSEQAP